MPRFVQTFVGHQANGRASLCNESGAEMVRLKAAEAPCIGRSAGVARFCNRSAIVPHHPSPSFIGRVDNLPLWAQICAIFLLLFLSGFFSISETSMMALNRHRLKHLANQGSLRARTTQGLLAKTDQLLSVILIGNNLINTIIPVLTTSIALRTFGHDNLVLSIDDGHCRVPDHRVRGNRAEDRRRDVSGEGRAAGEPHSRAADAHRAAARVVRQPVCKRRAEPAAHQHERRPRPAACPPRNCAPSCWNPAVSCRPSTAASC